MKSKFLKYLLRSIIVIFVSAVILLLAPVTWSAINRDKPPVGYHFMVPVKIALLTGLEKLIERSPAILPEIEEFLNIEYKNAGGKSLQLDLYRLRNLKEPAPLLVFIHGGGWKSGERSDYLPYLIPFAMKGYVTATVSYRFLADSIYPACVEDITDAVRWFCSNGENYGFDPGRIALIGGSAGGHLSTLAGYGWTRSGLLPALQQGRNTVNECRIKAVVDIYGPVDLTTDYARSHPLVTALIGHSYEEAPDLYSNASPITYLDSNDPPTLILHGTSDSLVPVSQSDDLKKSLDSLGIPCTYYRLPLWPHSMDIVQRVNLFCQQKMEEFFRIYLAGDQP